MMSTKVRALLCFLLMVMTLHGMTCSAKKKVDPVKDFAGQSADGILAWAMNDILLYPERVEWDALGRYLQAMAFRIKAGNETYRIPAERLAEYIVKNARDGHADRTGWGLRVSWDANSDGTVNAANTVYTYTTCWVAFGLLDARTAGLNIQYDEVLNDVVATVQNYIPQWKSPDGTMMAIRYSDNPNDWNYLVQNVTAYTYLLFIRMAVEMGRTDLLTSAQNYFVYQSTMQREDGNWSYYDPSARPPQESDHGDDLNHWGMEGVALYSAHRLIPNEDVRTAGRRCADALRQSHFNLADGRLFYDNSSIDWGVAEALRLFQLVKLVDGEDWVAGLLDNLKDHYVLEDGRWFKGGDNHQTQSWYACAHAFIAE